MEMDWKERRTVTILSVILAVLFAAVLIVLGMRYRASRPEPDAEADGDGSIMQQADHSALRYNNGSATLSFALDEEGKWIWADDPSFPLNDATVTKLMELLADLKPQQTITPETEEDLGTYGLDEPAASIVLTQEDGHVTTLDFGKTTTDGDSYYIMKNGDRSTLYIIADTLYLTMQTPIYDMCRLPSIPSLTEGHMQSLFIQGAVPPMEEGQERPAAAPTWNLIARWAEVSQTTLWFQGDTNVTESQNLRGLLEDLRTFTVTKCVDYHPSDEAAEICGFTSPTATLRVGYTTESGAQETFSVIVGSQVLSGAGRYVRLNDDTSVYLAPENCVDALLAITTGGLENRPADAVE